MPEMDGTPGTGGRPGSADLERTLAAYGEALERSIEPARGAVAGGRGEPGGRWPDRGAARSGRGGPRWLARPSRPVLVAAAVVVAVLVAGVLVARRGSGDHVGVVGPAGTPVPTDSPSTTTEPGEAGTWTAIAPSPLSARENAVAVTVGGQVLVVGGDRSPCSPAADCVSADRLADAAVYDPSTDTWRAAADPPGWWTSTAWHSGPATTGTEAVFASGSSLAVYDLADDRWTSIEGLPGSGHERQVVAREDTLFLYGPTSDGGPAIHRLDRSTDRWETLVADPLGPTVERRLIPVDGGLVLVANPPYSDLGPRLVRAARFDEGSGFWTRLADQPFLGNQLWSRAGDVIVEASPGGADGGTVNGWGRWVPYGGQFDGRTGESAPLGDRPVDAGRGPGGATGFDDAWVIAYGQAYRPSDRSWLPLEPPPSLAAESQAAAWVDGRLFVWGGVTWGGDGTATLSATGALWTPPGR